MIAFPILCVLYIDLGVIQDRIRGSIPNNIPSQLAILRKDHILLSHEMLSTVAVILIRNRSTSLHEGS